MILLLTGCQSPGALPSSAIAPTPPSLPLASEPATIAIPHLLATERSAAAAGDLLLLGQLWSEDGRIIDQRATADPADDYLWQGRAAIVDRYQLAVIPNPPPPLPIDRVTGLSLHVAGDEASLINDGDRWRFVYREGRWWLHELIYNPAPDR
jgi:hypothetical protein